VSHHFPSPIPDPGLFESVPRGAGLHLAVDLSPIFGPGFFESEAVHVALAVGALVAIVTGVVGVFTVIRGQSFAGEAFGDLGTTGGAGGYLIGVGPLWGFVIGNVIAAGAMEAIGIQRSRGRDLATGIVLGAGIGLAALFLYLYGTQHSTTGATFTIVFGSIFAVASSTIPLILLLSVIVLALTLTLYRPLLLSSVSGEMAAARGIPVRLVGALYLLALALAVALAAITIGTILSTALIVGPAASALRLTRRPLAALLMAAGIGVGAMWVGIVLAYDSFDWPPVEQGWPVSFFVVTLVFITYLLSGLPEARCRRRADRTASASPVAQPATPS
jgi:zinc/manganese transport system permease protein